jgi:hypothetical protein
MTHSTGRLPRVLADPLEHAPLDVLHPHPVRLLLAGVDDLGPAVVPGGRAVVEVRDQAAARLVAEGDAAVRVEEVGLVAVHEVLDAREPLALPRRVGAVPLRVARRRWRVIEVLPARIGAVVRHPRERAGLVAAVAVLPPGEARAQMLGDAEGQPRRPGRLLPLAHDVAVRAHLHGVPAMVLRVPQVEVVVVDTHADEIARARLLVEGHQPGGIPLLGLPQRDDVLPPALRGMAVPLEMVLVLLVPLPVHVPRVPVPEHRDRLRTPVRPEAELGVAEPLGTAVPDEGVVGGRERALRDDDRLVRPGHGRHRRERLRQKRRRREHGGERQRCSVH